MAGIVQAAEWMREGKAVRRAGWKELNPDLAIAAIPVEEVFKEATSGYGAGVDCVVHFMLGSRTSFSTTALLADDWEIAQ